MTEKIQEIDDEFGELLSSDALYKMLRKRGIVVTRKEVQQYKDNQEAEELTKQSKRKIEGHTVAFEPDYMWTGDLLDLQNLSRKNQGYKYLLIVIDIFTRIGTLVPLKDKTRKTVSDVFEGFYKTSSPVFLLTDNGSEFKNNLMKKISQEHEIKQLFAEPQAHKSLGIIDRFSRTIKTMIRKYFTINKTMNWKDGIAQIEKTYNARSHAALDGLAPDDVENNAENMVKVIDINMKKQEDNDMMADLDLFHVGDTVRVREPYQYKKGWTSEYSEKAYKIDKMNITTAVLDDGRRVTLENLQKVVPRATEERGIAPQIKKVVRTAQNVKILKRN